MSKLNIPNTSEFDAKSLNKNQVLMIGGLLLFILITTRSHFFTHIQDASWAIFFILGFYVRKAIGLPLFLLAAFIVDLIVIESKGGESYCFTVSYPFLAPAYGSLWLAGRLFANNYSESLKGLAYFGVAAVVGITVCDVISSGGFYWLSGRFEDTNMTEFVGRIARFLPMYLKSTLLFLGLAAIVHLIVTKAIKGTAQTA